MRPSVRIRPLCFLLVASPPVSTLWSVGRTDGETKGTGLGKGLEKNGRTCGFGYTRVVKSQLFVSEMFKVGWFLLNFVVIINFSIKEIAKSASKFYKHDWTKLKLQLVLWRFLNILIKLYAINSCFFLAWLYPRPRLFFPLHLPKLKADVVPGLLHFSFNLT